MTNNMKTLAKAISAHKQYLNPKKLFKRTPSTAAAAEPKVEFEQFEAKPSWKVLGARKVAREAMSGDHESPLVAETQSAVLSNRLAWKVLAHRRNQRLALSETANGSAKNLGCCSKSARKLSIQEVVAPYLAEVELACADVEHANFSLNTLVVA